MMARGKTLMRLLGEDYCLGVPRRTRHIQNRIPPSDAAKRAASEIFDLYAANHELRFLMNGLGFLVSPMRTRVGEYNIE
jgi:hypothetical protein